MDKFNGKLSEDFLGGDYESDFEFETRASSSNKSDTLAVKLPKVHVPKPKSQSFVEECSNEYGRIRRLNFLSKDAYTRHKELINHYVLCYSGSTSKLTRDRSKDKTDHDVIKENHQFLWDDEEDNPDTWEKQLAKKYYDKLFKEYCLVDLSRYKENKIAMRWRTEMEVVDGKGQFSCGHIRCNNKEELRSWEVNFGYVEHGIKKNALVKVRLCPKCSYKLNYHHKRKEVIKAKKSKVLEDDESHSHKKLKPSDEEPSEEDVNKTDSSVQEKDVSEKDTVPTDCDIWKKPITENVETSSDLADDFEKYLIDMLL